VEDEEHVLLQCGAYDELRKQLDADIEDMTALSGLPGRAGAVRLLHTLHAHSHNERLAQADADWVLHFILAGHTARPSERVKQRNASSRRALMQRCKRYCGDVMRARKQWLKKLDAEEAAETDTSSSDDEDSDGEQQQPARAAAVSHGVGSPAHSPSA
jgi:hypothetical protein